jgi:DNA-binding MarR family transcriptional regulator
MLYNTAMNKRPVRPAQPPQPASLYALLHTAGTAQAHVEAELERIGLSMAKLLALNAIAEAGESLPLGQLADRLSCVKSNITQLIDRLEADGLVARQSAPGDRRTRLAAMTAAGRKAWKAGTRVQQKAERTLFESLSATESRQLELLMGKIGVQPE